MLRKNLSQRRETDPDQPAEPEPPSPAAVLPPMRDKLQTARGFVIGIAVSLAIWAVVGAIFLWLMT